MSKRHLDCLIALTGVFAGALLGDMIFSDGIQGDDCIEAFALALAAAVVQWKLGALPRREAR